MIITHSKIDISGQVRVWVETDIRELYMLKLGTLKDLGIDDLKQIDERPIFDKVDAIVAANTAEKEAYPDKRIEEIDLTIAQLTAEKVTLEAEKTPEDPIK